MFNEILVPIDLEEESSWRKALPVAVEMCRKFGTKIHLMTVVPTYGMALVGGFFPKDFEKKAFAAATDKLAAFAKEHVPEDVPVDCVVRQGTIYEEIVNVRAKLGDACDLIVMASHRPKLEDYLLGPNAARVLRHSKVTVMVVRE
ncbi:MAG: universal stress protein [Alphaproteobacteria bacterium]|nr:universal stress protein [Alphaproteobacteria bacterium]